VPELPEVETVRADLEGAYAGRRITGVSAPGVHRLRRHTPAGELVPALLGRRVERFGRHGKYLLGWLDGGGVLVAHLGMSGQWQLARPGVPLPAHAHVVLEWEDAPRLLLVDPRAFGELWLSTPLGGRVPELAHLGPDALAPGWTARDAAARLGVRRTRLKPLLTDQRFLAGIGNIYADEILWAARLGPDRPASSLSLEEVRRLWRARRATLAGAVALRGSTLGDRQYRDLLGGFGSYQERHQAYGRAGLPCRRCRTPITTARSAGRSTSWCPRCQAQPVPAAGGVTGRPPGRPRPWPGVDAVVG
jgi:formamidopyrimidine-DNA glycosylase